MKYLMLIVFVFFTNFAYAECESNVISKNDVATLGNNIYLFDVVKKFGAGCMGGDKIINTMYKEKNGGMIFFFLRNHPKPASILIESKKAKEVPVYMAVYVDKDQKSQQIIWPSNLVNVDYNTALKKEYFAKKKCLAQTIDKQSLLNLTVDTLTAEEVVHKFGTPCVGGFNALTLQYKDENNADIWFWLSNKPQPAIKSFYSAKGKHIKVVMAVKKQPNVQESEQIIWPKKFKNKRYADILHQLYFSDTNSN